MPPQLTSSTSESERDAARRVLSIVSATEAGPADVSTGSILSLLRRYWRTFQEWRQRQSSRVTLQDLSDRELMDIGLTRGEIDYITSERAIDTLRDRATDSWSRGVI